MRKAMVDYRKFRFSKLNTPEFSHLWLLLGWVVYFALYVITENFIPVEDCYVVHSPLDDMIPFCELFLIPYVGWYLLVAGSLLYFGIYNVDLFKKLQTYIIITQVIAMTVYIVFPNMQDLRPAEMPRDNILTWGVNILYTFDTNTNVCPSLHVGYSLGIMSTWLKDREAPRWAKVFVTVFVILVCMSVAFIKQHSVLDIFAAIPMCLFAEALVFGKSYWFKKIRKQKVTA